MHVARANPKHIPLICPAARQLGVELSTLKRAVRGKFPNPDLVSRYRDYVNAYLDEITAPLRADATLSPQAAQTTDHHISEK